MKLSQIGDKVIEFSFYLLFFLVPLVMTPWNFELFEFNKMMLTYALTAVITGTWVTKMVARKEFIFRRTPFDIPLLLFFFSQLAATIFSIDRHTSLWGYYSRFHGGLLSTTSYLLLYYAFVSNFDKQRTLTAIRYMLSAATLVALYGVAEHFGIDAQYWVQDVKNRVFSTLGQPNWLAAYLAALVPITLALGLRENSKFKMGIYSLRHWPKASLAYFLFTIYYLSLLFTKSRSGFLGLGVAYVLFGALGWLTGFIPVKRLAFVTLLLTLISLLVGTPFTPDLWQIMKKVSPSVAVEETIPSPTPTVVPAILLGGTESGEIRNIVWKGAIEVWKHYPIFGSGVETFGYSYYQFRPVEHNLVSEWDFLYNKAHNEYLNFLATTGIVGLGSYLLLIGWMAVGFFRRQKRKADIRLQPSKSVFGFPSSVISHQSSNQNLLKIALFAGWTSILITNFFGFSVVPVALFFFLFPAIGLVISQNEEAQKSASRNLNAAQYAGIIFILLAVFYLLLTIVNYWRADVAFTQGNKLNKIGEYNRAFTNLQKAVNLNPGEPTYNDELAWSAANLAVLTFEQKQSSLSADLVDLAISSSNKALATSPRHLNFFKTRAKIFYKLSQINSRFLEEARETLLLASQLAPTEAKIFYNLGLVQVALGQTEEAIKTLEKTIKMKANYQDARYGLALLYREKGEKEKAIRELEYILTYINPGHPEALQKLKEWKRP